MEGQLQGREITSEDSRTALPADDTTSKTATQEKHSLESGTLDPPTSQSSRPSRIDNYRRLTSKRSLTLRGSSPSAFLQSKATTALSLADVHTQIQSDASSGPSEHPRSGTTSRQHSLSRLGYRTSHQESDAEDNGSVRTYNPILDTGTDSESLFGDVLNLSDDHVLSTALDSSSTDFEHIATLEIDEYHIETLFRHEFHDIDELEHDGSNEEYLMQQWTTKLKHFFILSSAGKPIYSRHGSDQLVSNSIGILQTIIASFQGSDDEVESFSSGDTRFTILSKGHLHLAATSRIGESDAQLRSQLEALYMQILSTLTLPKMKQMFINRPSTDLRKPLQGTDSLLSALADGFTRGSPSTLLGALECLKLRKSHRATINNTMLKVRTPNLLYGLIAADGRLVSVLRPKKQSLYPGDLQLIFNMLFEAESIRTGGGENWVPLCLPGFNNTGYLYMYVSFLDDNSGTNESQRAASPGTSTSSEIAIILISHNNESFYELRGMRDALVEQFEANGSMKIIRSAMQRGRQSCADILPGTCLRHFIYKSRANVQFTMSSADSEYRGSTEWRKLMCLYNSLNASLHSKTAQQRVHHRVSRDHISLGWMTPTFELYCLASSTATRMAVAQNANKIVQWARREEERLFLVGGAVF